jgi:CHAT domain-containing protein
MVAELRATLDSVRRQTASEENQSIQELQGVWSAMSVLADGDVQNRIAASYKIAYDELRQRESDLVAEISAKSEAFRNVLAEPEPSEMARRLSRAILVDIVRVDQWQPSLKPMGSQFGDPLYVATVLFGDGRIDSVDLGDAKPIDDLVAAYLKAQEVGDNLTAEKVLAEKLGHKVLDPLIKLAGKNQEWYLSADGPLRLIPFGAILLPDGRYAAEQYRFWSLGSGRDLLLPAGHLPVGSQEVVLANPDYGIASSNRSFAALPETEEEASAIQQRFPNAQVLPEGKRNKETLLGLQQPPRILHLATHGYFRRKGEEDGLLRAGIALDGANVGPEGVLTAKEAQSLPLNGTELVVVSACETGVGDVSFSEGLSGLQRSLAIAGARTELLTLWPVNSERTRDFMDRFYRRLATGRATKGDAWIETQREMIHEGLSPHVWAPFILYGDPGLIH